MIDTTTNREAVFPTTDLTLIAPSRLARRVAEHEWPQVQQQTKMAPGIFGFSSAGHGGMVGIIPKADFTEPHLTEARRHGEVHQYVILKPRYRRGVQIYGPAHHYSKPELANAIGHADVAEVVEVFIGEEDCGWALVAAASPAVHSKPGNGKYLAEGLDIAAHADASIRDWAPFFPLTDGTYVPVAELEARLAALDDPEVPVWRRETEGRRLTAALEAAAEREVSV